ncbi:MAG: type II secretion system protein N [Betaproteobacteria bacterium]
MRLRYALPLLLLLLVAALAACAPASLADSRLDAATAGRLRLADAAGTVWRGSGVLADATGNWRVPLAWRASPLAALRGVAEIELEPRARRAANGGVAETPLMPQGRIVLNGGLTLGDLRLALPAAALAGLLPALAAIDAGGDLALDAPALRFDGRGGDGALSLRWERARVVVNGTLVDLGTVIVRLTPRASDVSGTLANEGGVLRITGDVAWTNGQLVANAALTPIAALPPAPAQALAAIGPADANGTVRVSWRGTLR